MKYVVIRDEHGSEFPVFCVAPQTHADLATAWRRSDARQVVSAGFVDFAPFPTTGKVSTFGFSDSLKLGPRDRDAKIIAAYYRATLATATPPTAAEYAKG